MPEEFSFDLFNGVPTLIYMTLDNVRGRGGALWFGGVTLTA